MCSSHCPDEKGTESHIGTMCAQLRFVVAAIAPMKRGLKDPESNSFKTVACNAAPCVAAIAPMKRGLKGDQSNDI